jgi:hypothetical protein
MRKTIGILLAVIIPALAIAQETGEELVAASIKFHDPENNWSKTKAIFNFSDTRPYKEARPATLYLNNTNGTLCIMGLQDGAEVTRHTENDICSYDVNGNFQPSAEEIKKYSLNEKRSLMLRNYYLYLWGLPMKLTDPGTRIDTKIYHKEFNGKPTRAAKVTYDAEVGSDIWGGFPGWRARQQHCRHRPSTNLRRFVCAGDPGGAFAADAWRRADRSGGAGIASTGLRSGSEYQLVGGLIN